jgi:hypothetical protein
LLLARNSLLARRFGNRVVAPIFSVGDCVSMRGLSRLSKRSRERYYLRNCSRAKLELQRWFALARSHDMRSHFDKAI